MSPLYNDALYVCFQDNIKRFTIRFPQLSSFIFNFLLILNNSSHSCFTLLKYLLITWGNGSKVLPFI